MEAASSKVAFCNWPMLIVNGDSVEVVLQMFWTYTQDAYFYCNCNVSALLWTFNFFFTMPRENIDISVYAKIMDFSPQYTSS